MELPDGIVGGLLGTLTQKLNAATSSRSEYVRIASIELQDASDQEGVSNTITLLIIGGNSYTTVRNVSFVSITSHRGIIGAGKNTLLGSSEIGYSLNGQTLDVWIKTPDFRHQVSSVLLGTTRAVLTSGIQVEMPNNYQVIE